jgi:Transposase DDE domain
MLSLQVHHIVDLYCWVDNMLPKQPSSPLGGRPALLQNSELVTLLLWDTVLLHQKTLKDLYTFASLYLRCEFPQLPKYNAFLEHCKRVTPPMFELLSRILLNEAPLRFMDSTMLPVCKLERSSFHKVARSIANYGKNHQGWHYGFKLHASITARGELCSITLTPANVYDAQMMPRILNKYTKIAVGDSHYGAKVMGRIIWEKYGTVIIAPPHYKQNRKLMSPWQHALLSHRSKIEAVFDILKNHLHLVSSFPRSVFGYLTHYVRILLGYQIIALAA